MPCLNVLSKFLISSKLLIAQRKVIVRNLKISKCASVELFLKTLL